MSSKIDIFNKQLRADYLQQNGGNEDEINKLKKDLEVYNATRNDINIISNENSDLEKDIKRLASANTELENEKNSFKQDKSELESTNEINKGKKVKIKEKRIANELTFSDFLENINFYQKADPKSKIFYKGILINSFYELEFHFPYTDTDKDFNEILRCRCVSIGVPNIRKNYTSLNFNGRRIEIEQTAEFQHEIQLRIICDDEADIYYKFKEYIDFNATKKPKKIFNNSKIYICLNGFKTIELNHITISDLGQLEFDNGPSSNICFFNVTLKIIDYKFVDIENRNEYDKLTFEILKNKKEIKDLDSKISSNEKTIEENSLQIKNNENRIRENNETIKKKNENLELELLTRT